MGNYGKELILDIHCCNSGLMNRKYLKKFYKALCKRINMTPEKCTFWDEKYTFPWNRETEEHLIGTSAVQFIRTSNITIHTLTEMERVYLNIFTCKDFSPEDAEKFCVEFWGGKVMQSLVVDRV